MKKTMLVLAGVAVLTAGAYCCSQLFAQAPAGSTQAQPTGTRVAIVNIGLVFNEYERATAFKKELEETLKPFKEQGKTLTDQMKAWHGEMQSPTFDQKKKEQYEQGILNNKRKLEDMQRDIQKLIGKKQEDNLATLWKEVNMGIEKVSQAYGFQIVFGYGDPMEKELLNQFPNINRKMQAMDQGSTIPLYVHGSVDLSKHVAAALNSWIPKTGATIQPTSGTK